MVWSATSAALTLTGTLTLDGQGNPDAVFIFQATSTLITGSDSSILLTGGAQACNVYWQVGTSATIGESNAFAGNIVAFASITLQANTKLVGRALARNAAVSLDANSVGVGACTN